MFRKLGVVLLLIMCLIGFNADSGAAIYMENGNMTVIDSNFTINIVSSSSMINGAAISTVFGDVKCTCHSRFIDNKPNICNKDIIWI
jgi:hypothetical protein